MTEPVPYCPCRVCSADTAKEWGVEMEDRPERSWLCQEHYIEHVRKFKAKIKEMANERV